MRYWFVGGHIFGEVLSTGVYTPLTKTEVNQLVENLGQKSKSVESVDGLQAAPDDDDGKMMNFVVTMVDFD